jgi:perosamine synthetase
VYVADWPPLNPIHLLARGHTPRLPPFPFNAAHRTYAFVARNLIFHLFRTLPLPPGSAVLMPEYHSGVEVWAVRAAGLPVHFYPVNRRFEPDLEAVRRLARTTDARVLYAIHFAGWPQPLEDLVAIAREHDLIFFEDCALALFSADGDLPLGATGDFACFCLYKTLPVPNGGLLVQNRGLTVDLSTVPWHPCSTMSLAGRTADITIDWIRDRANLAGAALAMMKRGIGRALSAHGVARLPVGDISPGFASLGFDVDRMNVGMSPLCERLIARVDRDAIRRTRRRNFLRLRERLAGRVPFVRDDLADGVCPLFAPVLVANKIAVVEALRRRGIGAVGFWNYGHPDAEPIMSADTRFLREHVLELPIHQDLTSAQIDFMGDEVLRLAGASPAVAVPVNASISA